MLTKTEVTVFLRPKRDQAYSMERVVELFTHELPADINWKVVRLPHVKFSISSLIQNGLYARKHRSAVNHISGESNYLVFFLPRKNTILTIHDLLILDRLKGVKRFVLRWFFFALPVYWVGKVTAISQASKKELKKWTRHSMNHAEIVYDPYTYPRQEGLPTFSLEGKHPVFMTIGTKCNKNIERCIEAADGLPCRLLIIGRLTKYQSVLLEKYKIDFENRYDLSEEELLKAYRDCDALLFPSLGEGFGMPILEAHAFGRPVITSDCSSMPEVAGEGAYFVDPNSVASIREAMCHFIDCGHHSESLVEMGYRNLMRFSPSSIASAYAEMYRKIAE